jgi:hypothetical protein
MEYYAGEYYARITQQFKRKDGTRSHYDMLSGNGQFTMRIGYGFAKEFTKSTVKESVHKQLKQHVYDLDSYTLIENNYGWIYERFVKSDEDVVDNYEIVNEGEHTDHEIFDVYVFYIQEDDEAFLKLKP